MNGDFNEYLEKFGEIGYVSEVVHAVVRVSGLPSVAAEEVVMFETGEVGQVLTLESEFVEVLPLSGAKIDVGSRVARTQQGLWLEVGEGVLGQTLDALGQIKGGGRLKGQVERRGVNSEPWGLEQRESVDQPMETGVSMVDLVIPLGKGQRELVMGDRKTGKSSFLLQVMLSQARQGTVCVYAAIGKRVWDIHRLERFVEANKIGDRTVIVASSSGDPAGLIFTTPYTAMTIGEYFRDQGKDVLVILDDLSTQAKFYRQIALLARRFPGRSSYPGDIFYIQAKLLERAGNFKTGSITCLPVAESIFGDMSGYIQTNLMAMTDGHIFFDGTLADLGRRPSINPFLSVTRVGRQAQRGLVRELSRELSRFLTYQDRMRSFMHFGAELTERVKRALDLGERVYGLFELSSRRIVPVHLSVHLLATLWAGLWDEVKVEEMKTRMMKMIDRYTQEVSYQRQIDQLIANEATFSGLVTSLKRQGLGLTGGEK